jgi:hypothetical protein
LGVVAVSSARRRLVAARRTLLRQYLLQLRSRTRRPPCLCPRRRARMTWLRGARAPRHALPRPLPRLPLHPQGLAGTRQAMPLPRLLLLLQPLPRQQPSMRPCPSLSLRARCAGRTRRPKSWAPWRPRLQSRHRQAVPRLLPLVLARPPFLLLRRCPLVRPQRRRLRQLRPAA